MLLAGAVLAMVAATAFAPGGESAAATSAACKRPAIGFLGPLTGNAAFIGKEQLGFARYAVRALAPGEIRVVSADTQLDPRKAATAAKTLHADRNILAVIGPAGSQEVLAVAPVFKKAGRMPFVSGSAVHAALTNGSIPNFFRVAPNERVQPTTIARFILRVLKAKSVVVVDDRTAYSRPLADRVQAGLRAGGVRVARHSVDQKATEFSSLVAKIGDRVDVVFVPWQIAPSAQIFGQQLKEQGKQAVLFGSDALDSGDFSIAGSYVSAFAPDIRRIEGNAAFIRGYGAPFASNFGPLVYVATQAAIAAIEKACADGDASRAEVQRFLKRTFLPKTVLGRSIRFTPRGDVEAARFSVFRLGLRGKKTMVG